jgi:hypothetical protein
MDKTFVVWKSYHKPEILGRGYWDQGLLEDIFKKGDYEHVEGVNEVPEGYGAIFIINGRTHIEDMAAINADIAQLRWVLFIDTGDEEATFPWREVKHPIMKVWMMLPRMNEHNDTHFKLPNGYRPTTRETLSRIGYQEKTVDWFFAGQVNHERREQCVQELTYLVDSGEVPNGVMVKTYTFGEEKMAYEDYMRQMSQSKIVLCPSGIESPDNFRLYEALEAGCLPVVDAFSTKNKYPGFWRYLFGDDIPFPIVDYWDVLPRLMPQLLRDYPNNANACFSWWQQKKREIKYRLIDDVKELSK